MTLETFSFTLKKITRLPGFRLVLPAAVRAALVVALAFLGLAGMALAAPVVGENGPCLDSVAVRVAETGEPIFTVSTYEPAVVSGRPRALLLAFHGGEEHRDVGDGAERTYRDELQTLLQQAGVGDQFVVVVPHSPGRGWRWDAPRFEVQVKLRALTQWAFGRYSIDPRRVYYIGRSNGGASSGPIMLGQPGLFAALFAWTGGPEGGFDGINPQTSPEWYLVASGGEVPIWAEQIIGNLHKLEARGLQVIYHEPQGYTHGSVHERTDIYADGFRWFLALRNKAVPPPPAAQSFLNALAARTPFRLGSGEIEEVERIGGAEAGRVVGLALRSSDVTSRLAAADSCTRVIYGAGVWEDLVARASDADTTVRLKAIEALGVHARWRYFDALERLSAIALDRTRPEADRLAAIRALDFAVLLDGAHGLALDYPQRELNLRPTRALWTWIDLLLTDDAPELRRSSAAALERHHPGNHFGYIAEAAPAVRRAAALQWEQWGIRALGEKYRPNHRTADHGTRHHLLTVWSNPLDARVYLDRRLIGLAPVALEIEGTADGRFLAPTQIIVDAISADPAVASRLTVRWFGAGDLIPNGITGGTKAVYESADAIADPVSPLR